jgi:hypothetical protein
MTIYRKIYETFYGQIPKDQDGRTFDIHHIDGDKTNNSIFNLVALSIQDHYDVHYIQGDYGACMLLSERMNKSNDELSSLSRNLQFERIRNGNHHFCDSEKQRELSTRQLKRGTHPFLGGEMQKESQIKRAKLGLNIFCGSSINEKMLREGKHPSQQKKTCPKCNKTMSNANYRKWNHGETCVR